MEIKLPEHLDSKVNLGNLVKNIVKKTTQKRA